MEERYLDGGLSLEAAMVSPLFFFTLVAILKIMFCMTFIMDLDYAAVHACESYAAAEQLKDCTEQAANLFELGNLQGGLLKRNETIDSHNQFEHNQTNASNEEWNEIGAIENLGIESLILLNLNAEEIMKPPVLFGMAGLSVQGERDSDHSKILHLRYALKIFEIPGYQHLIEVNQSMPFSTWEGKYSEEITQQDDAEFVYVTKYGAVYHTSLECQTLNITVHPISKDTISAIRNHSGEGYLQCEFCEFNAMDSFYYITDYGSKYHSTVTCQGLVRHISRIRKDETDYRMCLFCKGEL